MFRKSNIDGFLFSEQIGLLDTSCKFVADDHLPLVAVEIEYHGVRKTFNNVLLDTGCSSTILNTDLCEDVGLMLDLVNAITLDWRNEICIEQKVSSLTIENIHITWRGC